MASLIFARPGKASERLYLGDLACLFDRQRRRSGLALTLDSLAADLASSDALRSALFTLCTAISRMGESDLSPEELLDLVVRALSGADSAEGESGMAVPAELRDAFLSGYAAWQARGLEPIEALTGYEDRSNAPDGVIPFPGRQQAATQFSESAALQFAEMSARRRAASQADPQSLSADDRPRGIDALLAAAPTWANAIPPARASMHEGLGTDSMNVSLASVSPNLFTSLYREDGTSVSSATPGGVQAFLLQVPPRKVFFALAGLTVLAGALAGVMAYRTLHSGQTLPSSESPEPTIALAATSTRSADVPADAVSATKVSTTGTAISNSPERQVPLPGTHIPAAALAADAQAIASAPLDIPAPTMIGYAVAMPQPAYSTARSLGVTGTVAVNIVVSRVGDVVSAEAVSGPQQLYAASVRAVRGWRFRPYLVDGRPVEVATTLQFAF